MYLCFFESIKLQIVQDNYYSSQVVFFQYIKKFYTMTDIKNTDFIKKITPTDYDIHPLIKSRWSPRVFANTPITSIDLHSLFEAGRWAASSNNLQPWTIIYGLKGSDSYDRIFDCLDEFNQSKVALRNLNNSLSVSFIDNKGMF